MRHVGSHGGPSRLVVGVHAQPSPEVFGHLGSLLFGKGLGDSGKIG